MIHAWCESELRRWVYVSARDGSLLSVEHSNGCLGGEGYWIVLQLDQHGYFESRLYQEFDGWPIND